MTRFEKVTNILDASVGGGDAPVFGPHGAFWRGKTRDEFVNLNVIGQQLIVVEDGNGSNLVKALKGEAPFGLDIGTSDAMFPRMPARKDPVPDADIEFIRKWIDDGCPEE